MFVLFCFMDIWLLYIYEHILESTHCQKVKIYGMVFGRWDTKKKKKIKLNSENLEIHVRKLKKKKVKLKPLNPLDIGEVISKPENNSV